MFGEGVLNALFWSATISLSLWAVIVVLAFGFYKLPIYHPFAIYLAYHFFGWVIRPISVYSSGYSFIWRRLRFPPDVEDIILTTIVSNLALLSCTLGLALAAGIQRAIRPLPPTRLVVRRPRLFWMCATALIAAGLYGTYRGYGSAGLESVHGFDVAADPTGGTRLVGVSGYTLALAETLPITCVILLLSRVPRTLAYGASSLFVLVRLYVGAQRLSFVVVILAGIFNWMILHGRRTLPLWLVGLLVIAGTTFDIVGHDRLVLRRVLAGEAGLSEIWDGYVAERTGKDTKAMDVVEYESGTAAIHVISRDTGHSYGTQYLRILIWPIPRQIWPEKPVFTSTVRLEESGYNFKDLTYTSYGDLYMTLGIPAVIVGFILFGWAAGRVYRIASTTERPLPYIFFWIFLIYIMTMLRDGGIVFLYFWAFSIVFAWMLSRAGKLDIVRSAVPPSRRVRSRRSAAVASGRIPPAGGLANSAIEQGGQR